MPRVTLSLAPCANGGRKRGAFRVYSRAEDLSPKTKLGTGELGLGFLGPEWIMLPLSQGEMGSYK